MSVASESLYRYTAGGNRVRTYKPHKALARRARVAVYARDQFTCQACGYRPTEEQIMWSEEGARNSPGHLSLDHIVAYRDGGAFSVENLRALCLPCNSRRGARP